MKLFALTAVIPWTETGSPTAEQVIDQLPGNLYLGAACCRVIYYYKPFKLKELGGGEPERIAQIWKRVWNTAAGAGKPEDFLRHYQELVEPLYS